ncbi:MAG: SpoIVB peptidase [Peptococcales bacterium]
MPKSFRKTLATVLVCLLFLTFFTPIQSYLALPTQQKISVGDKLSIGTQLPSNFLEKFSIEISDGQSILNFPESTLNFAKTSPVAIEPGQVNLQLKLFGIIPFKNINIDVVENIEVYPGGQAVGVILRTKGILVVGQSPILDQNGITHFPAKDAGIEIGDTITKINNILIETDEQLAKIVNEAGASNKIVNISIKRNNQVLTKEITPVFCQETKTYRIGLYVRDNAGGVGTLTFVDPLTNKYGALGHMICDTETNQQINITKGKLVRAAIKGIEMGKRGKPGEKVGMFVDNSALGDIQVNSYCGIFGSMSSEKLVNSHYPKPLPIAFRNQIQIGNAEILTVLENEKVEKFSISIEKIMTNRNDGKNMIIRISDPVLIKKTGGIIQGMSGSPIIQNGKIIGAVTHVFVNDPTRGYGIFIEDMLNEAGITISNKIGA